MKLMKKLFFFISLFMVYVIVKEFLSLYAYTRSIHPYAGYGVLILIAAFTAYFILLPVFQILLMPKSLAPAKSRRKVPGLIRRRMNRLSRNPSLGTIRTDLDSLPRDQEGYERAIGLLAPEAERIRKKYVTQLFYSSAISQNGFLDAILILSSSVNVVKELFLLYNGRVSNRDLLTIARKIYTSMAIGGSEGVEYATEEIFSKLTSGGIKSIPFVSKILGSLADGFVNAALLNRVSIITENYCKVLYLPSEKELYPTINAVLSSTRMITSDILDKLFRELRSAAKDKAGKIVLMTVNPVGYIVAKAMSRMAEGSEKLTGHQREIMLEAAAIARNPYSFGLKKITGLFKRRKELPAHTAYEEEWES